MSLLTLRRTKELQKLPKLINLGTRFREDLDAYINNSSISTLAKVVDTYSNYSYVYLIEMSETLEANDKAKGRMVIMNSLIVEACKELDILYFDREQGYSIIDKSVAYVVREGIQFNCDYILDIITEMNKEEDEDELVE